MVNYPLPEEKISVPRFEEEAGFYTTAQRSRTMSKIRSKNTRPEMRLRKALWNAGLRYRLHRRDIPGRPDIVIEKFKVAIFVDGEFWHGYEWEKKREKIKTNRAFWIPKIERNMQRDREVNWQLKKMGYEVFRFWENEVKKEIGVCIKKVLDFVEYQKKYQ
ncbi:MAG: very short patch repair endonuclease [Saprospiraceae bacterium]